MEIDKTFEEVKRELKAIKTEEDLENLRIKYLGRKGILKEYFEELRKLPPEKKREMGKKINELKVFLEKEIQLLREKFMKREIEEFDPTLPGKIIERGYLHVLREEMVKIEKILVGMGFERESGPEIESDFNNFTALNIPEHHPARDMQATLFLKKKGILLRTHTSPIQIRTMLNKKPPIRIYAPGRVYRRDPFDASHSPVFHQIEGLYIDENVTFSNLKGTVEAFLEMYFEKKLEIKFLPSYFPFTEPSAEVSILWEKEGGEKEYLEVMGCGMVHPQVLINCNINPEKWNGYAFGLGVERLVMIKYGIPDIRLFYENDVRFLKQFSL